MMQTQVAWRDAVQQDRYVVSEEATEGDEPIDGTMREVVVCVIPG